jgi:prevent-host-death family protein
MLTMLMVNIADAKAKLSEYVEAVSRGEVVIICNRNKPVAELRAVEQGRTEPRDLSPMHPGFIFMTDAFFEPMSAAELEEWYGGPIVPAKVAETPAVYGSGKKRKPRK